MFDHEPVPTGRVEFLPTSSIRFEDLLNTKAELPDDYKDDGQK